MIKLLCNFQRFFLFSTSCLVCLLMALSVHATDRQVKEIKHGIVFIGNQPKYWISYKVPNRNQFTAPLDSKKDLIKHGSVTLSQESIWVADVNGHGRILGTGEAIYRYKIVDDCGYISLDRKNWERIEIHVIDEKPHLDQDGRGRLMLIKLKSKFFNGTYEIRQEPDEDSENHPH